MTSFIDTWILETVGNGFWGKLLIGLITIITCLVLAGLVWLAAKLVLSVISSKAKTNALKNIATFSSKRKLDIKIAIMALFYLISYQSDRFQNGEKFFRTVTLYGMIVMLMVLVNTILDIIVDSYSTRSISKKRPIKGPIQVVKILIFAVLGIILVSVLLGQNPIVLISGIGTFTAILSIVFKDPLLGLVAGIQITSEQLLRIGDWIKITSLNVEGTVTDISLISVKITAYDNTIITVPAYTFLSVPFKNTYTAVDGKRQVAKTMLVDANSVKEISTKEASDLAKKLHMDLDTLNLDSITSNLGLFRAYMVDKLKKNPHVNKKLSLLCRTNDIVSGTGIPVEIIATVDIKDYDEFCNYSALIVEDALVNLQKFGLKPYQINSGS